MFYSAAPVWADCTVLQNENNGVDMICEGQESNIKPDTHNNNNNNNNNNNVTVQGDTTIVSGDVYGGYGYGYGYGDVDVTGNTVNINDSAKVSESLYGGYIDGALGANYDAFTGNTLNFSAAPITLKGEMANFENYNFTIDPALVNTDTALITADTIIFGTNEALLHKDFRDKIIPSIPNLRDNLGMRTT